MVEHQRPPTIQMRVTDRFLARVDALADASGEGRNDWLRRMLVAAVERGEAARRSDELTAARNAMADAQRRAGEGETR